MQTRRRVVSVCVGYAFAHSRRPPDEACCKTGRGTPVCVLDCQPWFRDSYVAIVPLGDQSVIMHTPTRHSDPSSIQNIRCISSLSRALVSGARSRLGMGPTEPWVETSRRPPHSLSTWDRVETRRGTVRGQILDGKLHHSDTATSEAPFIRGGRLRVAVVCVPLSPVTPRKRERDRRSITALCHLLRARLSCRQRP